MSELTYDQFDLEHALSLAADDVANPDDQRRSLRSNRTVAILASEVQALQAKLETTTAPAGPMPTGVWQVELTNGVVYNLAADAVVGGGLSFITGTSAMVEFLRNFGEGRKSITVLAVRPEKVVAYRRLGDWDGQEDLSRWSSARWATAMPSEPQSEGAGARRPSPFAPTVGNPGPFLGPGM